MLTKNDAKIFSSFEIVFRNVGIPIRDVECWLQFHVDQKPYSVQLGSLGSDVELAKGYIFKFEVKDYLIEKLRGGGQMLDLLGQLVDVKKQRATIQIRSQGYPVTQINCWGLHRLLRDVPVYRGRMYRWFLKQFLIFQAWGLAASARKQYLTEAGKTWSVYIFEHEGQTRILGQDTRQTVDCALEQFCRTVQHRNESPGMT